MKFLDLTPGVPWDACTGHATWQFMKRAALPFSHAAPACLHTHQKQFRSPRALSSQGLCLVIESARSRGRSGLLTTFAPSEGSSPREGTLQRCRSLVLRSRRPFRTGQRTRSSTQNPCKPQPKQTYFRASTLKVGGGL